MTTNNPNKPYHQTDHNHCWTNPKPPCGQRIEHYKCCLCELVNPKVVREVRGEYITSLLALHDKAIADGARRFGWEQKLREDLAELEK
jgi:hypothetical protein